MSDFDVDAHIRRIRENPFRVVVDRRTGSHIAVPVVQDGIDRNESIDDDAGTRSDPEPSVEALLPEDWAEIYADVLRLEELYALASESFGFRFGPPCDGCREPGEQFLQGAYVPVEQKDICALCGRRLQRRLYSPLVQGNLSALIWPGVEAERLALPEVDRPHKKDEVLWQALRARRLELAREAGVPAFVVFHDSTLRAIAAARPTTRRGLLQVHGVGPVKLDRYGEAFLDVVKQHIVG